MQFQNQYQFQAYQQASHNVGKGKQIIMLYDGVIRFVQQGESAHEKGEIEQRFNSLQKAMNIITGLQSSLDMQNYPEISTSLYDYYEMIYIKLNGLIKGEKTNYDEVIGEIKKMRDAWVFADESQVVLNSNVASNNAFIAPMVANEAGSFAITA